MFRLRLSALSRLPSRRFLSTATTVPSTLWRQLQRAATVRTKPNPAIVDENGDHSYASVCADILTTRRYLLKQTGKNDLEEARVAIFTPNSYDYVAATLGVWNAGGVAVPLCTSYPIAEHEYYLTDSQARIAIVHSSFREKFEPLAKKLGVRVLSTVGENTDKHSNTDDLTPVVDDMGRRAMIIYTSGTTGKPKGVVLSHGNIRAQVTSLVSAWKWTEKDRILHVLPLHHVHGVINALLCAIWSGATVEMMPSFSASAVWSRWTSPSMPPLSLFMGVPTMYRKLIEFYNSMTPGEKARATACCSQFRLMVSGSAALPSSIFREWNHVSGGNVLLERYGMTEIGMALSNPYDPDKRKEGCVGYPLPGVEARLVDERGEDVTEKPDVPGEIQIRGPFVFVEYFNRPEQTAKEFAPGRWFKTGDTGARQADGSWKILGRTSTDIIKSGGFKISALEIEREYLVHPSISDIAVVGIPDPVWGERVGASIVLKKNASEPTLDSLREWGKSRMASHKLPTLVRIVDILPRNVMGKVNKRSVAASFTDLR